MSFLSRLFPSEEEVLRRADKKRREEIKRRLARVPKVRIDLKHMESILSPRDYKILRYVCDRDGYLLSTQPRQSKSAVQSSSRLVWKFLRYYFSAVNAEEMEPYPMSAVLDLNPELRNDCTALFDLCKRIAREITTWPEPQRWGQFWHHQPVSTKKKR